MKEILVIADWAEMEGSAQMGILRVERSRGKETFSFTYDPLWLASGFVQQIDPDLRLFAGPQYLSNDKPNFGIFLDSSPDRWGRMLMDRREVILARHEQRSPRSLSESDYLLGVHDETRMGALRFRLTEDGPFLADETDMKAPPFASIRELEQASLKIEDDRFFEDKHASKWLRILIAPGSSLGGARPKANVRDAQGQLWIAKFPSKSDEFDTGAWEYLLNQLAYKLNIRVAEATGRRFSQKQHTYLARRFDRLADHRRLHFASAMTLLGYKDGYDRKEGGSYLELVELIETYGAEPESDIRELWKRVVFSVLVSNTDDHLRNHGFLLTPSGWRLSPAYDLNPNPKGAGLSLNISEKENSLEIALCLEVAPLFRWKEKEARAFIRKAAQVVGQWNIGARALSIPQNEQVLMTPAFTQVEQAAMV